MGRLRRKLLKWLTASGAVLGTAVSCREHDPWCAGSNCAIQGGAHANAAGAGSDAGGAPASAGAESSDAGEAATPDPPACRRDVDCGDSTACNGAEQCIGGACQPGDAPSCTLGTRCVERAEGHDCRYDVPSPWLIVRSQRAVYGLPAGEIGQHDLVLLGEQEIAEGPLHGFDDTFFSPDGSRLWINFFRDEISDYSMFQATLGSRVPGELMHVRDLPRWGYFFSPVFSADSRRGFIEDEYSGVYLFDFSEDPSRYSGKLLGQFAYESFHDPAFCSDSDLLVVPGRLATPSNLHAPPTPAWLFEFDDAGGITPTEIGAGVATVASGGAWMTLSGPDHVELVTCTSELHRVELSPRSWRDVSFRHGDNYVELNEWDEYEIYSVADPGAPVLAYACSECTVTWDDSEAFIHVTLRDEELELELRGDQPPVSGRPETPEMLLGKELAERVRATGTTAFLLQGPERIVEESGGGGGAEGAPEPAHTSEFDIVYREDPTRLVPIVRAGSQSEGELLWSNVDAGLAIVGRSADAASQFWVLLFHEEPFTEELVAMATGEGGTAFAVSPDLRGFAYTFLVRDTWRFEEVRWQPFERDAAAIGLAVFGQPIFGPMPP